MLKNLMLLKNKKSWTLQSNGVIQTESTIPVKAVIVLDLSLHFELERRIVDSQ